MSTCTKCGSGGPFYTWNLSWCCACVKRKSAAWRAANPERVKRWFTENPEKVRESRHRRARRPESVRRQLFVSARRRAARLGLPFEITLDHVQIPDRCPVLGCLMVCGPGKFAPSLDRIVPERGYVPGNVAVISKRANQLKNDASAETLRRIADWIDSHVVKSAV